MTLQGTYDPRYRVRCFQAKRGSEFVGLGIEPNPRGLGEQARKGGVC